MSVRPAAIRALISPSGARRLWRGIRACIPDRALLTSLDGSLLPAELTFRLDHPAGETPMNRKLWLSVLVVAVALGLVFSRAETAFSGQSKAMNSPGASTMSTIAGTGTLSGTLKAPAGFTAAK